VTATLPHGELEKKQADGFGGGAGCFSRERKRRCTAIRPRKVEIYNGSGAGEKGGRTWEGEKGATRAVPDGGDGKCGVREDLLPILLRGIKGACVRAVDHS
jgi:hypothetical protein